MAARRGFRMDRVTLVYIKRAAVMPLQSEEYTLPGGGVGTRLRPQKLCVVKKFRNNSEAARAFVARLIAKTARTRIQKARQLLAQGGYSKPRLRELVTHLLGKPLPGDESGLGVSEERALQIPPAHYARGPVYICYNAKAAPITSRPGSPKLVTWDRLPRRSGMGGLLRVKVMLPPLVAALKTLKTLTGRGPAYKGCSPTARTVYLKYGPFDTEGEASKFHEELMILRDHLADTHGITESWVAIIGPCTPPAGWWAGRPHLALLARAADAAVYYVKLTLGSS